MEREGSEEEAVGALFVELRGRFVEDGVNGGGIFKGGESVAVWVLEGGASVGAVGFALAVVAAFWVRFAFSICAAFLLFFGREFVQVRSRAAEGAAEHLIGEGVGVVDAGGVDVHARLESDAGVLEVGAAGPVMLGAHHICEMVNQLEGPHVARVDLVL